MKTKLILAAAFMFASAVAIAQQQSMSTSSSSASEIPSVTTMTSYPSNSFSIASLALEYPMQETCTGMGMPGFAFSKCTNTELAGPPAYRIPRIASVSALAIEPRAAWCVNTEDCLLMRMEAMMRTPEAQRMQRLMVCSDPVLRPAILSALPKFCDD